MLKAIKASLAFMTPKERSKWLFLTGLKSILSVLDLAGILAIGFILTSTAIFLTSGSDPNRVIEFAGLRIPAVNAQTLPWFSAAVLLLFLFKALAAVVLTKKAAFHVAKVEARSAKKIAEISFGGDLSSVRKRSREEVMYAIQTGSPSAFNTILNAANALISEAALFLLVCIGFLFVDAWATLAAIAYFALIAAVMQYFVGSLMTKAGQVLAESSVRANGEISDLISVFRELFVLGRRDKYIEGIYRARVMAAESTATQHYLSGMPRYIIEAALLVGVAIFVLSQALTGDIVKSAATIGVFLSGGFRLTAALLPLQNALLTINAYLPVAKTAQDILADEVGLPAQSTLQSDGQTPDKSSESSPPFGLKFESVSYSYPDATSPVLRAISFEIESGSQVALMGPSGAGKSTIADLMCKVLSPTSGTIRVTGSSEIDISTRLVSYVPQRPGLVSGTILDNIALGENKSDMSRERALEALNLAHLSELIASLPEGLDTELGKLQDGLSGGQIQRLGLARALYTSPGLLVMDEATSALDAVSEGEIQVALNAMRGRVTVVLIAHRLNTIQHADKVLLVEEGQIKDFGTFRDLLARNPSVEKVVDLMRVETD
jgi:ATP-binding cassette subfamily C protein